MPKPDISDIDKPSPWDWMASALRSGPARTKAAARREADEENEAQSAPLRKQVEKEPEKKGILDEKKKRERVTN